MCNCRDLTLTSVTAWSADSIFSNVTKAQLGGEQTGGKQA